MTSIVSILRTLGDTDVTHIFTHHITTSRHRNALERLPGYEYFDQRALMLARPNDLVCVAGKIDRRYVHYLQSLGLGPKDDRIIEVDVESNGDFKGTLASMLLGSAKSLHAIREWVPDGNQVVLHAYHASSTEFDLAARLRTLLGRHVKVLGGNADVVACANLKHFVYDRACELSIPMAPGELVELPACSHTSPLDVTPLRRAIDRYISYTGRVIVRGTYGAGGSGTFIAQESSADIERTLRTFVEKQVHHIYLVQVMFDIVATPNVQMYVEPDSNALWCVGATDQRVDQNLEHEGNVYPSNAKTLGDMISSARKLASWLGMKGFRGLAGFDFVEYVHPTTGKREHIFAEMNPRINGATYPAFVIERLNVLQAARSCPRIMAFLSAKTTTTAASFSELEDVHGPGFFDPSTGRGIIPYNTGRLTNGLCDFLFVGGSRRDVEEMYQRFASTHALPAIS